MKQVRGHQEPSWLNDFLAKVGHPQIRLAMKSDDLNALQMFNTGNPDARDLVTLRNVLGNISAHLNSVSEIYNYGSRSPSPEFAMKAQQVLPDLQNIDALKVALQTTQQKLLQNFNRTPAYPFLANMIHAIQQSNFTPEQVQTLTSIAQSGNTGRTQGFVDEADPSRLRQFLKQTVYGSESQKDLGVKLVREVLQNACDAVSHKANKTRDPQHVPTILLNTHIFSQVVNGQEVNFMDLQITDNGVGMNWDILSNKFFRYFESGKEDQGGVSAGGFGIAKALIQETPQHGWAIDTNGIHSSRFGRNMYLGTPMGSEFQPPRSQIQETPNGTMLTLFGVPNPPDSWSLKTLAQNYAIGQVRIVVNGEDIEPKFKLQELKKLGSNLAGLAGAISDNETEKETIQTITNDAITKQDNSWLGDLHFEPAEGKMVNIEFALNKNAYTGQVYVLLNGQFQFEMREWLNKADLVVNVATNLTPKDAGYPVDAGRVNFTEPYKTEIRKPLDFLKKTLQEISEHQLFKDGLNIQVYNSQFKPLQTARDEEEEVSNAAKALEYEMSTRIGNLEGAFTKSPTEAADAIVQAASGMNLNTDQMAIVTAAAESLRTDQEKNINVKEEIKKIIEGLTTPATMIVQKNFVSAETIANHPEYTRHLMLMWQEIIKLVVDQTTKYFSQAKRSRREYVPGIVFSDECIALFSPKNPKYGQNFDSVAINPLSIAGIIEPEMFDKVMGSAGDSENASFRPSAHGFNPSDEEGLRERMTGFLLHEATHEVTHLLFPDSYNYDRFHSNISRVENACHFLEPKVRAIVRRFVRGLRSDTKQLLRAVGKDRKAQKKNGRE